MDVMMQINFLDKMLKRQMWGKLARLEVFSLMDVGPWYMGWQVEDVENLYLALTQAYNDLKKNYEQLKKKVRELKKTL